MKTKGILEKKEISKNGNNLSKTIILGFVGLILLLIPETLNKLIGIIVGFSLLLIGIITIYKYLQEKNNHLNLISGILYSILGSTIMIYPNSIINLATICLGVFICIIAFIKLQVAINLKYKMEKWLGTLIVAIIVLVLGLLLIFNPFASITVTKLAGTFLVLVAIFDIIDVYIFQKK